MKSSTIIVLAGLVIISVFIIYSLQGDNRPDESYIQEIKAHREQQQKFMQSEEGSPFLSSDSIAFDSLKYFPVDMHFKIKAKLEPIEEKKVMILGTSDGKQQKYLEYAFATFKYGENENRLLILEVMEMGPQRGQLFLAFADETSGNETYGAGRYLDIKKVGGATSLELDFNKAYNPYCAYNDNYSCPFPPKENILKIAVKAGEKKYH